MKKNQFSQFLVFLLVFSMLPFSALAAENGVEIVCADENLYAALTENLNGVAEYGTDPDAKRITLSKAEAGKVTALTLNNRQISDISGLQGFSALKELDISNNAVSDLSPLSTLSNLTSLTAYGNAIKDVSPILGLTALKSLSLAKNRLNDNASNAENCVTAQLSALTNLKTLDLSHNMIRHTAGLDALTNLQILNLYDNAIRNLSGLSGLSKLEFLSLGENNEINTSTVTGLDALDGLTALKSFNFDKNKTPEIIEHLGNMTAMETLSLVENSLTDISALSGMSELRELILFGNQVASLDPIIGLSHLQVLDVASNGGALTTLHGVLTESGDALVWPALRKLDIHGNWNWNLRVEPETGVLFQMAKDGKLELGYRYDRIYNADWSHLPHTDADGTTYVTYDDFITRCDGEYDDFIAIRNAHEFANAVHCDEVRATAGKTYHIFNYYDYAVTANTNIDWQGATFIIHDENIEQKYGRYWPLMLIVNTVKDDIVTLENPGFTIGRDTKKLDIADILAPLNEKGYKRYLCIAKNDGKRQFIRFGSNANAGEVQQDRFVMDAEGNLLNDVIWDFETLSSLEIIPIPNERGYVRNATIISNAPLSGSETPYSRGGKQIYFNRNFQLRKSSNIEVSNIRHIVTSDGLCGSYHGILTCSDGADVDIRDCELFARKFQAEGRSTYDIVPGGCVNLRFANIRTNDLLDNKRWGVMASNYCKDVTFEDCEMNRIDAHQGIYNLTVRNCKLGVHALTLTGFGTLNVVNTEITAGNLLTLRGDYGSTWTGDVYFTDCKLIYKSIWSESVFSYTSSFDPGGSPHDFGYPLHMPNLYIDNLTVDNRYNTDRTTLNVIANWDTSILDKVPPDYWPREMILNGVHFINNDNLSRIPYVQIISNPANGLDGNYVVTDVRFRLDDENGDDITRDLRGETPYETDRPVCVTAMENNATENRISLYRDGAAVFEDTLLQGTYQEIFSEAGLYRFTVKSSETVKGTSGEAVWEFRIAGNASEPAINAVILPDDGQKPLSALPAGSFRVQADISSGSVDVTGAGLWFAGYSQEGKMLEIQSREISDLTTVAFSVKNREGLIGNAKLFLLSEQFAPLCAPTDIGQARDTVS